MLIDESDEVFVSVVWPRGRRSAYIREGMVERTVGARVYRFADLFAGLFAFEAGVARPRSCVAPFDLHPRERTLVCHVGDGVRMKAAKATVVPRLKRGPRGM